MFLSLLATPKLNASYLPLLLPLTAKHPYSQKLKPCNRNRFLPTALQNTFANFMRKCSEKCTVCKTSACATSTFLVLGRIPVRPIRACSQNSVLPSWKKLYRLFLVTANRPATSLISTTSCRRICLHAKRPPPAEKPSISAPAREFR